LPKELARLGMFALAEPFKLFQLDLAGKAQPLRRFAHPETFGLVVLVEVV
jgi:hypothetical protein